VSFCISSLHPFRQYYVPTVIFVVPFLLFFHSTYIYFLSLAGPIYNIGYIYIYVCVCVCVCTSLTVLLTLCIVLLSVFAFVFYTVFSLSFCEIVRFPHISELRDLRAVSCLSFFAFSQGCKKVYELHDVHRVQQTNVVLRCLSVRGLGCWIAVCRFVHLTCPQMLI